MAHDAGGAGASGSPSRCSPSRARRSACVGSNARRRRSCTPPIPREESPHHPGAVNPDADYVGMYLTSVIARVLEDFRPTVVVIPHPYDRHPDHVHTTYFVTEAVQHLRGRGDLSPTLTVLTYLVHFPSWPAKRAPLFDRFLP